MTAYLDTSVLVSMFSNDVHTTRVTRWLQGKPEIVLSLWALTEFSSALAVQSRMRKLEDRTRRALEIQVDGWLPSRTVLSVQESDLIEARTLVRGDVRLRAADALHIAIVIRHGGALATLDADMAAVASDLGVEVVIP